MLIRKGYPPLIKNNRTRANRIQLIIEVAVDNLLEFYAIS